jgi:RNA polymerase sigma-70 factor (ECF subfamily)
MEEKIDAALIAIARGGNSEAFATLVKQYLRPVYSFVRRFTGRVEDADDITQETFIKVWKHLKRYDEHRSFTAWLFRIARNTAIDWVRRRRDHAFSDFERDDGSNALTETLVDDALLPDVLADQAQDFIFLEKLLAQLSPAQREVVLLRHETNMTFEEMSEAMNVPFNTVKSRYRRALAALQALVH